LFFAFLPVRIQIFSPAGQNSQLLFFVVADKLSKFTIMQVKTDTKERFHVITLPGPSLSASMTEELSSSLLPYLQNDVKNLVLILKDIQNMDNAAGEKLVEIQQKFYESNASFVICEMQPAVEEFLDQNELLELMNVTPTQSEAMDIVQMEEIERELLDDDEDA
jgi:anti-anti-sigma factor